MKVKDALLSAALSCIIVNGVEWDMLFAMFSMWVMLTLVIWDILINIDERMRKIQIGEGEKMIFVDEEKIIIQGTRKKILKELCAKKKKK